MISGCLKCSYLPLLWIISSFLFLRSECSVSLDVTTGKKDTVDDRFAHVIPVPNVSTSCSESNVTASAPFLHKDCFTITNVSDSTIIIQSNQKLKLRLEKCNSFQTSSTQKIRIGTNFLQNLEACTTYSLVDGENCSALVQTLYRAPEPVNIKASVTNGILNLTWSADKPTNCVSHYKITLTKNANLTTEHKSPVIVPHHAVPVSECEHLFISVTTVDIKGQKQLSDDVEVVVRDNTAAIIDPNDVEPYYSYNMPWCPLSDDDLFNKSKRETGTRKFALCKFHRREHLSIGSHSVTIRSNFSCAISKCRAECCSSRSAEKCAENPHEHWYYKCAPLAGEETTIFVTGDRLIRDKMYYCAIEVEVGSQKFQQEDYFYTRDGRPAPPGNVWSTSVTHSSFIIMWEPSEHTDTDPVDYYVLTVLVDKPSYAVARDCQFSRTKRVYNTTHAAPQYVDNLLPYFLHEVYVDAYNSFGYTRSDIETIITKSSDPGPCRNVYKTDLHANSTENDPVFIFNWSEPCFWNGQPRDTKLVITGRRPDNAKKLFRVQEQFYNIRNSFRFNASRDFVYTVELYARVDQNPVKSKLCALPWTISIPPGLSSVTSKWSSIRPEVLTPDDGGTPIAAIPLTQDLLDDSNGTIKHVAIMVAEKGQQGVKEKNYLPLPNWPNARNWNAAMTADHVLLYQATPKYWYIPIFEDNVDHAFNLGSENCDTNRDSNETSSAERPKRSADEVTSEDVWDFRNGEGVSSLASNTTGSEAERVYYCNGPLRKNTEYIVRLRIFTKAGYSDSDEIYFRTGRLPEDEKQFYDKLWFYAIFPIFLASTLLTAIWIKKKRNGTNAIASAPLPDSIESVSKSNQRPRTRRRSISPQKLPEVATRLLSQRANLEREFEELNEISAEWASKVPCNIGLMKENRLKNRYADVVPYDYNRVKLSSESTSQTDYINASYIKGFSMDTEYIACQGPTIETSNDFWQMVFDQHVCFIVMLTSLVENGMAKCSQYFSELCENKEWMDFTVKCTSRLDLSNYTVRELQLYKKTSSEKRSIQHFQFRDWPDFGCPSDIDGVLEFSDVLRGNLCLRGDSKTVVHCSAGIGRTGTLIALDILLQFVHYNRKLDILRTVRRLREQRQWMVRTVDQYAFLYRCLKTAAERHFSSVS